jgi:hypothetical protein
MAGYKNPGWNNGAPPALNAENLNALCNEVEEMSTEFPEKQDITDKLSLTLAAASWTGSASPYTQGVTITGGTATSQADIQADATAIQQMLDDSTNAIYIANNNGTFTAYAVGEKPTADLIVQVTVYDVKEVV